jgi:excisionase family DNA binding protein
MQLLTVDKLSERWEVPKSWIYRKVRENGNPLPKIKLGKYLRFNLEEVEKWMQANR